MNKRFIFTIFTLFIIVTVSVIAISLAKGYRFSPKTGAINGTGIISITTIPDQASIYIDGHLTTASNANVSSLLPKSYDVKIVKDGFIPWEKKVEVKEGLVSQIKATLFPAIPTVYPLTFNGVEDVTVSEDGQRIAFIVPAKADSTPIVSSSLKKSGVWVWEMLTNPLSFAGGPEPHRIADLIAGVDYSAASIRFSPDSSQVLITLPDRSLLMDENKFNDTGRDITATLQPTVQSWNDEDKNRDSVKLEAVKDPSLKAEASASATLRWSADETKFLMGNGNDSFKVIDLTSNSTANFSKVSFLSWLPDSRHLVVVEETDSKQPKASGSFPQAKISIVEIDGSNKSELYVGNFDPLSVIPWPDQSRLVIVSSVPTPTGSDPNLFGINLK